MNNVLLQPPNRFKYNRRLSNFVLKSTGIIQISSKLEMFTISWKELRNSVRILVADNPISVFSSIHLARYNLVQLKILQVFYPLSHNLSHLNSNQPEYHLPLLQWHIQLLVTKGIFWTVYNSWKFLLMQEKLEPILRAYCYYLSEKS